MTYEREVGLYLNATRISWRQVSQGAKAMSIAFGKSLAPEDLDAIVDALADSPAQADRMRSDYEMSAAINSARNSGMRPGADFGNSPGGW